MRSTSWLLWWDIWKKQGLICWVGVIILFFEFKNQGILLIIPILTGVGYVIMTIYTHKQVKKIRAGKFLDKIQSDKEIERTSSKSIIMPIILIFGILGFSIFILTQILSSADLKMEGDNYTHNCMEAASILYSEKTGIPFKPSQIPLIGNVTDNAKKTWVTDSCNNVMLNDDFGNQCMGSIGLAYYGSDQNGNDQWYCQNIPKSAIQAKLNEAVANK